MGDHKKQFLHIDRTGEIKARNVVPSGRVVDDVFVFYPESAQSLTITMQVTPGELLLTFPKYPGDLKRDNKATLQRDPAMEHDLATSRAPRIRAAAEAAETAARRSEAEAGGTYFPKEEDAVVYMGQRKRCSGKELLFGAEGRVVDVTAESVKVRFAGVGTVQCPHADIRKGSKARAMP